MRQFLLVVLLFSYCVFAAANLKHGPQLRPRPIIRHAIYRPSLSLVEPRLQSQMPLSFSSINPPITVLMPIFDLYEIIVMRCM